MKFIHLSAHLSSFSDQARPPSSLQHVYCILILLTFLVIFLNDLRVKYPLPIAYAPCLISLLLQLFPCTTGSPYCHLTHWIPTFAQFVLRFIPRLPLACPVVSSRIYPWPVVISLRSKRSRVNLFSRIFCFGPADSSETSPYSTFYYHSQADNGTVRDLFFKVCEFFGETRSLIIFLNSFKRLKTKSATKICLGCSMNGVKVGSYNI